VHTVPEHVMALMLALSRNLVAWRETVQAGALAALRAVLPVRPPDPRPARRDAGLIGSGTLGNGVARLAEAFGMRVLRAERKGAAACASRLHRFRRSAGEADAISLHCPLTPETQGLIGEPSCRR
jgi:glycerate dehydrogenase